MATTSGVLSPSANSRDERPGPRCGESLVVGIPGNRRLAFFQQALAAAGRSPAREVAYAQVIRGTARLDELVTAGSLVRIDSPGEDSTTEKLLLAAGADEAEAEGSPVLSRGEIDALSDDPGRILNPRQWYLGFCHVLIEMQTQLGAAPPHGAMNYLGDVAAFFDKCRCQRMLADACVPTPPMLGEPCGLDHVIELMKAAGRTRAFLKTAHGSSSSGVIALHLERRGMHVVTSMELVREWGQTLLYNSLKVRSYRDPRDMAELVDWLCRQRVRFEAWLPKASVGGRLFDLRVLVIGGRARHVVVRTSRQPFTNLHLGNRRGDVEALQARMGHPSWQQALSVCERAAGVFPRSLCVAVDLLLQPGFRSAAVLELNAFGDLLPGVLHEGQTPYEAALAAAVG